MSLVFTYVCISPPIPLPTVWPRGNHVASLRQESLGSDPNEHFSATWRTVESAELAKSNGSMELTKSGSHNASFASTKSSLEQSSKTLNSIEQILAKRQCPGMITPVSSLPNVQFKGSIHLSYAVTHCRTTGDK